MLFNAKNVQIDTEKIQEVINASGKYWFNTDDLIKDGILGYPVLASFGLASVRLPDKDVGEKNSKPSVLENIADKIMDIGNSAKNMINNQENFGVPRFVPNKLEINCSYGSGSRAFNWFDTQMHRVELTDSFNPFNCNNPLDDTVKIPRHVEKVVKLAEEIKEEFFGTDWVMAIDCQADLKDYINNVELFYRLEDALLEIRKRLTAGKINPPTIHYISLEDVMALNIIKIVDKGTDREANYYTGNCSSIIFEALVNGKYNLFGGIQLLKTMVKANKMKVMPNAPLRINHDMVEVERFDSSYIVNSSKIKSIMCTRQLCTEFISIETMGSLKDTIEAENDPEYNKHSIDDDSDNESAEKEPGMFDDYNSIISFRQYTYSQFEKCQSNEIIHLIIPNGMDLSNSFKAKYN